MVLSSQHHINLMVSNKCNQKIGTANKFLENNYWTPNTGIKTNNSNANYVFNHQICDENSRLRLDNSNTNTSKITSELNLVQDNQSPELNSNETMPKSKSGYKKLYKNVHDPNLNTVITSSTLKYAALVFLSLFCVCTYVSFIVIGSLGIHYCDIYKKVPIYLLVFGIAGIVHIFLYFSCPFYYSKSIVAKMYEHLIWRLIINRFSASVFLSNYAASSLYENSGKSYSDLSACSKFNVKASCCSNFVLHFFCCNCCCFSCCKGIIRKATKDANSMIQLQPSTNHLAEGNSNLNRNLTYSNSSSMARFNASLHSISNKSDNNSERSKMKKMFPTRTKASSNSNSLSGTGGSSISNFKIKRSKSSSDLIGERNKKTKTHKRAKSLTNNSVGNHYFNGKYGNKYSTHKHLYRHHKKTQAPIKLIDCNTIRYCVFFWIRQSLLLFILVWFICGNYWVFDTEHKYDSTRIKNSTRKSDSDILKKTFLNNNNMLKSTTGMTTNDLNPLVLKIICYDFGFYQIIIFYCIFALTTIVIVILRIFHKSK